MPVNLSPQNRDYLIRTVIGEAAGQPRMGQAGVAHTILNRRNTGRWGDSVQDVVLAENQFEPWGTRADELYSISPDSDVYQQTGQLVDQVAAGQVPDPTQGGLFFLNPDIVRERRGGSLPDWAQNQTASIGQHSFYRGPGNEGNDMANGNRRRSMAYQPQREAGTGNLAQAAGQMNTVPTGQALPTKQAQSVQPLDIPSGPSQGRRRLAENLIKSSHQMGANTAGNPTALWGAIAQNLSGNLMSGLNDEATDERRKALARAVSEASGDRARLIKTLTASGDPELMNAAIKAQLTSQKPQSRYSAASDGGVFDKYTGEWKQPPPDPGAAAVRKKEAETVGTSRGERRKKIFEDAEQAISNNRRLNYFEKLNKEASTGGWLAEASLGGKRFLGFLGIDAEAFGLPDNASASEALQALTTRSALDVSQQTKGAISDREMDMFQQAVPSLMNTREGNQLIIDFLRTANQRRIALNNRAVEYVREYGTLDEGFAGEMQEIYEANPIPDLSEYAQPEEGQQGGSIEPGTVEEGYRFKGGDPGDPNNWEQVQPTGQQAGPGGFAR